MVRDEVELTIEQLGPGGGARAGSWAGVLIGYRDSALSQREIVLRITGLDRDGDPPAYQRTVVGDPERARTAWLYAPMPYQAQGSGLLITAHEAQEADVPGGFRAGRVLGRTELRAGRLVQAESPLIGVIGERDAGLRQYGVSMETAIRRTTPRGNAAAAVISSIGARDLPDRWQGLVPFETIVWSRGGPDADPNTLDAERARAVREWVQRGGHLVVILPPVGQTWTAGTGRNPIADLLPAVRVERREGVSLEPYRPLLTLDPDTSLPARGVVHTLIPGDDATPAEASPILSGPDGVPVVVRRLVGQGMVTLVGLDVAADPLVATNTLDAEAIWHRVLGRRRSLDTFDEAVAGNPGLQSSLQRREVHDLDDGIERTIDFVGDAGKGVLLGLGVFALYWLVAGPLGFFLLARSGHRSKAWVAFIATGGVFTAVAWAGATALRPNSVRATHLTFLDSVYAEGGAQTQTARSWFSVLIPRYGQAMIELDPENPGSLLSPWTPPPPAAGSGGFPDNRAYTISSRRPGSMSVPVRSTIKQLAAVWSGPARENLPRPARRPGSTGPARLSLVDPMRGAVEGALVHDLPGPLSDVMVVVVAGQRDLKNRENVSGLWMPSRVYSDSLGGSEWAPGDRLDLAEVTSGTPGERSALAWLNGLRNQGRSRGYGANTQGYTEALIDRVAAISFLEMIGEPDFLGLGKAGRPSPLPVVRDAHALDLSRWFTQPCVIVIGSLALEDHPLPFPLTVDGEQVPARGTTIVRWVYPLDPAPPAYAVAADQAGGPADTPPGP